MQNAFLLLMLVSFGALLLGLVRPTAVLPTAMTPGRLKVLGVYLTATLAFFIAFGVVHEPETEQTPNSATAESTTKASAAAKPSPAATATAPIAQLADAIKRVNKDLEAQVVKTAEGKYRLTANYRPTSVWSESNFVLTSAMMLQKTGSLAKESGLPVEEIQFHVFAPSVDAYGNSGTSKAFVFTLSNPDLDKINWKGIGSHRLLNLPKVEFHPMGRNAVIKYCSDKDNAEDAPSLCRQALAAR
ncbi:hypothetical protein [Achromobacter sp. DH1f]|uniref:hypothetical protein n=1 Tax=Achromobacter sp. DH1f TaxID=1397275 RepID=UPI00046A1B18|nr:hypothetical protein [Achromobacter sp. DH1f]